MSEKQHEDNGQFVRFPVHLIYGNSVLTRDDKWVLLAIMGKCWKTGPYRLSYREISYISDVPLALLSSSTNKKTGERREGIIDRIVRVTGYLSVFMGKDTDEITGRPRKQTQMYIAINYPAIWQDNLTFCKEEKAKSVPYANTSQPISVPIANATVPHTNASVPPVNGSVPYANKSVHNASTKPTPYITVDYLDITDYTEEREGAAFADATPAPSSIASVTVIANETDTHYHPIASEGLQETDDVEATQKRPAIQIVKGVMSDDGSSVAAVDSGLLCGSGIDSDSVFPAPAGDGSNRRDRMAGMGTSQESRDASASVEAATQHTPVRASSSPSHSGGAARNRNPQGDGPRAPEVIREKAPDRGAGVLSRSGEKPKRRKAAPAPVDLKSEPAEIQRRLNERRGYCLETAGEIIQERKAIKAWCTLHTLEEFETVMDALQQDDPYWKKPDNKHRISGVVLARETPKVLAKQRRDQRPPVPEEIDPYSIDWLRQLQAGRVAQA